MKRNHLARLLLSSLTAVVALSTQAQIVGLPVLDTADRRDPGQVELMPGMTYGHEMNFIGGRVGYSFIDELRGFVDVGRLHVHDLGDNIAMQAGGVFSMPTVDFCETGLRAAGYYVNTDSMDMIGGNLMILCSGESLLDDLFLYSGFGVDISERKVYTNHGELNPALAAGLSYRLGKGAVLFLEGDYIDGFYVAGGVSLRP